MPSLQQQRCSGISCYRSGPLYKYLQCGLFVSCIDTGSFTLSCLLTGLWLPVACIEPSEASRVRRVAAFVTVNSRKFQSSTVLAAGDANFQQLMLPAPWQSSIPFTLPLHTVCLSYLPSPGTQAYEPLHPVAKLALNVLWSVVKYTLTLIIIGRHSIADIK